ncbi:hypothetical protein A6E74_01515 [Enterococcus thailandicus]|uniref:Uncharacterized protein n=2 Tax=Enterococcus thailandicus TaxID=417368 RepID=A0A179EVR8_ENTTH|nr:hypothetical protein A6E74_01515 [Enterococcus thailandicus]
MVTNCRGIMYYVKPDFYTQSRWEMLRNRVTERMNVMEKNQREQRIEWLKSSIQNLERFKLQVEQGKIILTDGYMENNYPLPQIEKVTENNITLSIDFVETGDVIVNGE